MTRIPARADHSRKRRSGIERPRLVRLTSPATPSAASRPVSRVGSTPVAIWNATGRQYCPFTTRKLTQFSVPRKMLSKLVEDEVTCADSVYGTTEMPYFDSSTSGTDQEPVTRTTAGIHQVSMRALGQAPGRARMYRNAGTMTATADAAFIPLHSATATAERATARARADGPGYPAPVPRRHGRESVSGTRIQGSIAIGRNSPDIVPMMASAAGDSA